VVDKNHQTQPYKEPVEPDGRGCPHETNEKKEGGHKEDVEDGQDNVGIHLLLNTTW
jgi:hypothetical protein